MTEIATRSLPAPVHAFLAEPDRFATVATLDPDGMPHLVVAWYLLDGDALVLNSKIGRRWPANLLRDPRVSLCIEDGYRYVVVRGTVEPVREQGRAQGDIATMARRYHRDDPAAAEEMVAMFAAQERISFLVRPERVAVHLEG